MRICIISDIHYGEGENYGKVNPDTGLNTRLEDIDRALNRCIDYCLEPKNEINVLLISGDIYKLRKPTPTQQLLFVSALLRLLEHNKQNDRKIKVVIFTGNHDVQRSELAHSTSAIAELTKFYSDTLWIDDKPHNYVFEQDEEKVLLCTIPYLYRQKLKMASNEQVVEFYRTLAKEALRQHPDATCKILAGHQTLEGCSIAEYQDINSFNEIIVPLDVFEGYDFVSQGHIHKYQVLRRKTPLIVFQGNPVQLEFDEVRKKGFIIYDTKMRKHKRVVIGSTKFVRIEIDTSEEDTDATSAIVEELQTQQEDIKDAIVKIKATVKEKDLPIRNAEIKPLLKEVKHYAGLDKIIIRENSVRSKEVNRENNLETILSEIAKLRQYGETEKKEYLALGLEIEEAKAIK